MDLVSLPTFLCPTILGRPLVKFGFAWYYDRTNSYDPAVGIAASLIVTFTARLALARRTIWYRVYLAVMLAAIVLHIVAGEYIVHECPGVWGSLLRFEESEYYAGP